MNANWMDLARQCFAAVQNRLNRCTLAIAAGFSVICLVAIASCQSQPQESRQVSAKDAPDESPESGPLNNPSFEKVNSAGRPIGWNFPQNLIAAGYQLTIDKKNPIAGKNSALVDSTNANPNGKIVGNLMQALDAGPYRGQRLRFRAAVRTANLQDDARAQLWFRVDRESPKGTSGIIAFDNMDARPIRKGEWTHYDIVHQIDDDAARMMLGLLVIGKGQVWIDDATLEVVPDTTPTTGKKMPVLKRPAELADADNRQQQDPPANASDQIRPADPAADTSPKQDEPAKKSVPNQSTKSAPSEISPQKAANASAPSRSNIPPPPGKPQPFFNQWLWLPAIAIVLFGLSQTNLGFAQRIAFRFSFAYWLLYFLPSPFGNLIPVYGFRLTMPYNSLVRKGVHWTATNVLGISQLFTGSTGSGDTTIEYIRVLNCFALACAIAVVWSAVDWRRTDYPWLKDLLRSYLRYVLAFVMLSYGLAKAGPVMHQFSEPSLDQLMQTYADSSPMSLVWIFMGVSPAYTRFAGLGEVIGALLLIWRRTAILGAIVTFGVMLNVMMLNFCYDVPVKQYSFHLVLMAVYLLMGDASRLANLFLWNQPVEKASLLPPYTGPRTIWVQRALKAYIIVMGAVWPYGTSIYRDLYPPETKLAQPAFYSSYEVDEFLVDGQPVPPLLTDNTRWRYFGLHRSTGRRGATDALGIRMMDRSARGAWFVLSSDEKTITLNDRGSANVPKTMTVELPDDQHLTLSGTASGKKIEVKLHKLKREDSVLLNRGFHWINELPFRK